ncbi:hypothetical protein CB0940_12222 [Cercospora beticola]|uniref:Restriction of telomere capping protein 4 n=1 Tax=Cercospora beticola TaxID=122368 RepID=A0A2G5GLM5_CERBT|nr:hypothetical protein CB0940_12222 [Cercospora beticola]PIA80873.1 hypothetical protein CB0940_12222 [Cercospora beticola]WPB08522.1 hypothetical protein RHO25_013188 [Cercospora beticola]
MAKAVNCGNTPFDESDDEPVFPGYNFKKPIVTYAGSRKKKVAAFKGEATNTAQAEPKDKKQGVTFGGSTNKKDATSEGKAPRFVRLDYTVASNSSAKADQTIEEYRCPSDSDEEDDSPCCSICKASVDSCAKQDFEDLNAGCIWNYKTQVRFCKWHSSKTARETWRQRGYPELDWKYLPARMHRHLDFLSEVLNGQVESYHRAKLQEQQGSHHIGSKEKQAAKSQQMLKMADKPIMGYYGPKGERVITAFVTENLARDLAIHSTQDKIFHAPGVQGGVCTVVEWVLAPHMVELLVKEDLKLMQSDWDAHARAILADSTAIGELLCLEDNP